ncbi:MAG: 4-hydroxy-3-methylbut-2-enyl diphosphate reductase [Epsilonproteobacteria bacterium]|nr:4-hydroxy-3-methylbut-2-enyl diphosphate reductase [Campylobacterota bacterium]OIO13712.1 MAG: 4-hydroxy-3-methylbut-2-enyl diphosphate reductase [Helicobacteraceae bacterium CG1_02_36_14]PIP10637.1 MAG: 4-hydroxy-3-methylbut-2-enyl diphosphate reductase [Sulfurimonas sp. CG23_combo_of_CG06-09_8_20_14_all_36_33]PIS25610.1 MAG: 4-hydroxy-3-methylbut-2-enyl diphosphate reductase [Sulfurimonas sp. CG08_land_8_20_14_0_20_36_33]PIU34917.1 MAG: 4-hydroxy-3-methylbut-2-enyl diphosphate reductase [S
MKIELAENYGFCFGVKRAIKIAEENKNSSTYGPLIHNSKEIERLARDFNVALTDDYKSFKAGDKAVIRTHGIPKNELEELIDNRVDVVDATCPYVTKPQQICQEMSEAGYDIIIFGDEAHPEIKGVKSYATHGARVVTSSKELESMKIGERVALVAQTTRKVEDYMEVANYLIPRHKEVRVFNTICNATFENQDAVRKLASKADIMIIVGGKNSSNTKQLFSISKDNCPDSYHIEDETDLEFEWFAHKSLCGISAGASTPDWIIKNVVQSIEEKR